MMSRFGSRLVSNDSFGQSFSMKFKDGNQAVPTISGFVFSIILSVILIGYSYQKFDILINKKDAKIFSTDKISAIADTEVFDT